MSLPIMPMISPAILIHKRGRNYRGPIEVGAVFAWEQNLPHARELVLVTKVAPDLIFTESFPNGERCASNDVSRFREAVSATRFRKMLTKSERENLRTGSVAIPAALKVK